jgi:rsbT co-antagonist protein RsbR
VPERGSARWAPLRDVLVELSRDCAQAGLSPSETATLVFLLKQPLFDRLRERSAETSGSADELMDALWAATTFVDELGLESFDAYLRSREDIIRRQQDELLELSTPVVKLWTGILAVPLIGTLDSARTQVVMESLLEKIIETDAPMAIIDITGVPTVDTLVAQHLLKTVAAARLMGADCIISGIRPQIAQTIVHLGLDLSDVTTKASLADALRVALDRSGYEVRKISRRA